LIWSMRATSPLLSQLSVICCPPLALNCEAVNIEMTGTSGVIVGVLVGVSVGSGVTVGVFVAGTGVKVAVSVAVGVFVAVGVNVGVGVGVSVEVGVMVGVLVDVSDGKMNSVGICAARLSSPLLSHATIIKGTIISMSTRFNMIHLRIHYRHKCRTLLLAIILLITAACQQNPPKDPNRTVPTLFEHPVPVEATQPALNSIPTETPTNTITPRPMTPTQVAQATFTFTPPPAIVIPTLIPTIAPTETRLPRFLPEQFSFGKSLQGRDLIAYRFGEPNASRIIMLVGGVHGGMEANTVALINEMISHFQANPADVLPGLTLVLIPALNPDGISFGSTLAGRFNANGVDLNRNWGCDWQSVAYFRDQQVNPGPAAFSELEVVSLAALINDLRPQTVLFYHSAANGIFDGDCNNDDTSTLMAAVLGAATGYPYGSEFTDYPVTGTAANWVSSLGIPSADVELASADSTEFFRNLQGVMAIQCWLQGAIASQLAQCVV